MLVSCKLDEAILIWSSNFTRACWNETISTSYCVADAISFRTWETRCLKRHLTKVAFVNGKWKSQMFRRIIVGEPCHYIHTLIINSIVFFCFAFSIASHCFASDTLWFSNRRTLPRLPHVLVHVIYYLFFGPYFACVFCLHSYFRFTILVDIRLF